MLNKPPSKKQEKAWYDRITQYGCVITRKTHGIQRHHPLGRKAKQNKLWIGRWFTFCLDWDLHDYYGEDPNNVTNHKRAFVKKYGKQSVVFQVMAEAIRAEDGFLPFPDEVLQAIMDTGI